MLLVILGWLLSGFVPALNITLIAIIGLIIFFLPSIDILSFGEFSSGVNWNLVFTMGSVSVLMIAIANTGLITNVTTFFTPFLTSTTIYWLLFGISVLICFIRAFVPTTTAVIALLVPMLVAISAITSVNYATLLLIASFWAATALLLIYTEPIYLISYKEGYFKQGDLIKVGLPASIIIAAICPYLIYIFMR